MASHHREAVSLTATQPEMLIDVLYCTATTKILVSNVNTAKIENSAASIFSRLLTEKYQFILNCIYNPILSTSILCCFNTSSSTLYTV